VIACESRSEVRDGKFPRPPDAHACIPSDLGVVIVVVVVATAAAAATSAVVVVV